MARNTKTTASQKKEEIKPSEPAQEENKVDASEASAAAQGSDVKEEPPEEPPEETPSEAPQSEEKSKDSEKEEAATDGSDDSGEKQKTSETPKKDVEQVFVSKKPRLVKPEKFMKTAAADSYREKLRRD